MHRSFAFRLAAAFALVGIAAAALTAILVNVAFGRRFTTYLQAQQQGRQTDLVRALQDSYSRMGGWNRSDLANLSALALSDGGQLRLIDSKGNIVWEPTATPAGAAMAAMHRQMMGGGPLGPEQSIPVMVGGKQVGTIALRLPEPGVNPQDVSFRSSVNRLLLLGGLIAGVLALGLGVVLARRTVAPARELTEAAQAIAAGERSHRVTVDTTHELGAMGDAFNRMADTIEEEDRLRRLFATDVAHELRTPLAILRTQIEALQDGVSRPEPEVLASLHEETLRITRLVEDLETLASAEAAQFSLQRREIDLHTILARSVTEFAGPYEAKGVELDADLPEARVDADPTRVGQIAANLLSNALKFTPAGGRVQLMLRSSDGWAEIRVTDSGPGIPPDERAHVFDRFFRGRENPARGSGIGLTVVRELANAHGGSAVVEEGPGGGATFLVRLPATSSPPPRSFTAPSHAPPTVRAKGEPS